MVMIRNRICIFRLQTLWVLETIHSCQCWTINRPEICKPIITLNSNFSSEDLQPCQNPNCPQIPTRFWDSLRRSLATLRLKVVIKESIGARLLRKGSGLDWQQILILWTIGPTNFWTFMNMTSSISIKEIGKTEGGPKWKNAARNLSSSSKLKLRRPRNPNLANRNFTKRISLF